MGAALEFDKHTLQLPLVLIICRRRRTRDYHHWDGVWALVPGAKLRAMTGVVWVKAVEESAGPTTNDRPVLVQPPRRELEILPVLNVEGRHRVLLNLLRIVYWSGSNPRRDIA